MASALADQPAQRPTSAQAKLLLWLLGACIFPASNAALLFWLGTGALYEQTLRTAQTLAWLATLVALLSVELFALMRLGKGWASTTPSAAIRALALLLLMGVFWFVALGTTYLLATIPLIPAD